MAYNELFYIGSVIIVGGTLGHLALLNVAKYVSRDNISVALSSFHGLEVKRGAGQSLPPIHENQDRLPATKSRGLLVGISERHSMVEKSWSSREGRNAIHDAIVAAREQNYRSTYLGASTFDKWNPSAQLFGWRRVTGKPTIQLGEIAQVASDNNGNEVALQLYLHPDDAHLVVDAGWGKEAKSSAWQITGGRPQTTQGVQILLSVPRNHNEAEEITKKVLEAAIWFVAGLDREEDV